MSDLEGEFGKNVGMLVERQWPRLSTTLLYLAAEHGELIGKWALKILVCVGKAGVKPKKIVPDEMAHALKEGKLPADFYVRLGHLRNPGIGTIINPYVHARHGTVLRRRAHKDGVAFNAVIALNHLAVGISSAPEMKQAFVPLEGALPVMAYPEKENSERENYSFHDAGTFEHALNSQNSPNKTKRAKWLTLFLVQGWRRRRICEREAKSSEGAKRFPKREL